jgi:competence protein ComEC
VLDLLAARRIRRLGLVVLSHPHPDHYLGLRAIARRVAIDELWWVPSPSHPPPAELAGWLAALALRGTRIVVPRPGPGRRAGRARLVVLGPRVADRIAADPVWSINDASLVVRLEVGRRRVLFAGDLEAEGEAALVATTPDLAADVVKVAHHGSATSSSDALIGATRPAYAIVSCGVANRFGFPAADVVERWRAAGAAIRRTDRDGAIVVTIAADDRLDVTAP